MLTMLSSCDRGAPRYRIGFSQCVGGAWREKVNMEVLSAQHLYNNVVTVDIANADDYTGRQVNQIDSFIASGVDILVVAPNDYKALAPAIERASKQGIPVVLFDRKVNTNRYTAYIGGDNIAAGRAMANYALGLLSEKLQGQQGHILEITGGQLSSPAIDRHRGFMSVMKGNGHVDYRYIDTDWSPEETYDTMLNYLRAHPAPDVVFCHSDLAALNARKAAEKMGVAGKIRFLGIDGMPGKGGGIDCVANGILAGTYIYPTNGEQIVKLCLDILQGRHYKRDNIIQSVIVTPDNAPLLLQTGKEMEQRNRDLFTLQDKIESLFGQYHTQRMLNIFSIVLIVVLVVVLVLIYRLVVVMRRINRKEKRLNDEQTMFYTNARHQLRTPLSLIAGPLSELSESPNVQGRDRTLVDIMQRNVAQLSRIAYDVFNFRNEGKPAVDDSNASALALKHMQDESLKAGPAKAADPAAPDEDSLPSVLVVDDNDDMRQFIRTLLADKYYVMEAADGASGLQLAREAIPDIIVSDVMMPVMDGLEFCRKIKADTMTSHIPVILLTARSTEEQQIQGLGSGADDYMMKPFSADLLRVRIENLLESRRKLRIIFNGKDKNVQKAEQEAALSPLDRKFMERLKEVFGQHLSDSDIKVDDLGAEIGLGRVQLYRKLKAITGLAPVEMLKQMRLEKAHELLTHSDQTVATIAYDTGFSSPSYFSRCFRDRYGVSPSDIRKTE